jgi:hypothetical protein
MRDLVSVQSLILASCQHCDGEGQACCACWNRGVSARRAAREAQLACRPNDCERCGKKPHTYTYGPYRLCGRCRIATEREHYQSIVRGGALAIFATGVMVNTENWATRKGD